MKVILLAFRATLIACTTILHAETCLSPFVKRLDRPEKFLYVWCVDADAKDNDFLAVVDVDKKSPSYSKIIFKQLKSNRYEKRFF